jgi:hypothetical protein
MEDRAAAFFKSYWNRLVAEKEGGEPMVLISCTRLDTRVQSVVVEKIE